jgi:hypothetical protein
MFINIFTPHIGGMISVITNYFKRLIDRGCSKDLRKTKQVMQEDYEAMYMGPDFLLEVRYS